MNGSRTGVVNASRNTAIRSGGSVVMLAMLMTSLLAQTPTPAQRAPIVWRSDGSAANVQWLHDHCANVYPVPPECVPYMMPTPRAMPTPHPRP